jgi:hypothetical protein
LMSGPRTTMPGVHDLWLFILTGLLLNATPGPDIAYIVGRSAQMGVKAGVSEHKQRKPGRQVGTAPARFPSCRGATAVQLEAEAQQQPAEITAEHPTYSSGGLCNGVAGVSSVDGRSRQVSVEWPRNGLCMIRLLRVVADVEATVAVAYLLQR